MEGGAQGVDKCNVIAAAETWHLGWQGYVSARRHSDGPIFNPNRYLRRFSMKRVTKWVGTGLAGLVGLVVIAMAIVYGVTSRRLSKVYNVTDSPLTIPSDSVSIVKGYHIVQAIGKCAACHGDDLAGKVVFDNPVMGRLYSANLTRGRGGIGGSYKDADYVRIIRHGVARDGHPLQFMPTDAFYYINDADLANTIAYLKTIPAVDATVPTKRIGPLARVLYLTTDFPLIPAETVPLNGPRPLAVARGPTREYGLYLATTGGCRSCHLKDLSGGVPIAGSVLSANLTPTGIGNWSELDFRKALRNGIRPDGRVLSAVMPWRTPAL
jgi:mono/diheme cytochrome c family protein